eukprot:CAMPEP_0177579822 /NCGR_PEP_ID=MMETSP0419_2-20121207/1185_1 /TAXON_ID=582737 /ORGANISM="Tetraselmis sp., Strain GSL018" /LENGTH=112 /DNA_ID=CAMNT_0019068555 /DNA_START=967 /DNA_END=1302 /DNA_ORIENTATION=-
MSCQGRLQQTEPCEYEQDPGLEVDDHGEDVRVAPLQGGAEEARGQRDVRPPGRDLRRADAVLGGRQEPQGPEPLCGRLAPEVGALLPGAVGRRVPGLLGHRGGAVPGVQRRP